MANEQVWKVVVVNTEGEVKGYFNVNVPDDAFTHGVSEKEFLSMLVKDQMEKGKSDVQ